MKLRIVAGPNLPELSPDVRKALPRNITIACLELKRLGWSIHGGLSNPPWHNDFLSFIPPGQTAGSNWCYFFYEWRPPTRRTPKVVFEINDELSGDPDEDLRLQSLPDHLKSMTLDEFGRNALLISRLIKKIGLMYKDYDHEPVD